MDFDPKKLRELADEKLRKQRQEDEKIIIKDMEKIEPICIKQAKKLNKQLENEIKKAINSNLSSAHVSILFYELVLLGKLVNIVKMASGKEVKLHPTVRGGYLYNNQQNKYLRSGRIYSQPDIFEMVSDSILNLFKKHITIPQAQVYLSKTLNCLETLGDKMKIEINASLEW